MGTKLEEIMDSLSSERRDRVNARAAELIAEERSLREVREAERTQGAKQGDPVKDC